MKESIAFLMCILHDLCWKNIVFKEYRLIWPSEIITHMMNLRSSGWWSYMTYTSSYGFSQLSYEYLLEELTLKLKLQYFVHLMWRTDSLQKTLILGKIEARRRRGWQRIRLDGHEFEQAPGDGEGQRSLASYSPWGHRELDMTGQLNNNNNN